MWQAAALFTDRMVRSSIVKAAHCSFFLLFSLCACTDSGSNLVEGNAATSAENSVDSAVIVAQLNGEPQKWRVYGSQSDWRAFHSYVSIGFASIYSFADASDELQRSDVLSVGFTLAESSDGFYARELDIAVTKQSAGLGSFSSENDGTADIAIHSAIHEGDSMHIVGSFSGRLPFRLHSSRDTDLSNVLVIENGQFDVVLAPLSR
jgi:hypothetical protein